MAQALFAVSGGLAARCITVAPPTGQRGRAPPAACVLCSRVARKVSAAFWTGLGALAGAHHTLALAGNGVRSSIVRLPPGTHGNGDNGFTPTAIGFAREKGAAAYVGDGTNRRPAVHRDDAARLFRLALESAPAGSVLHAGHYFA
jgi:hypothetical protein